LEAEERKHKDGSQDVGKGAFGAGRELIKNILICLRRDYRVVVVKNDAIISTGYTGAPRGAKNCIDIGYCRRSNH
jgi:deoxycytidylate deaminase